MTFDTRTKAIASGGLGLSAAGVIWMYATFGSKSGQEAQWRAISALKDQVADLKADAKANDAIIRYYFRGTNQ